MATTSPPAPPSGATSAHAADASVPSSRISDVSTAAVAGIIAGVAFMLAQMVLVWLVDGQSPRAPPHLIAAMVLGPEILPPADFSLLQTLVALAIHLPLSALYGIAIGALVSHFRPGAAVAVGVLAGLAIYGLNFYLVVPSLFPWFVEARGPVTLFTHGLFGALAAGVYAAMRRAA